MANASACRNMILIVLYHHCYALFIKLFMHSPSNFPFMVVFNINARSSIVSEDGIKIPRTSPPFFSISVAHIHRVTENSITFRAWGLDCLLLNLPSPIHVRNEQSKADTERDASKVFTVGDQQLGDV